MAPVEIYGLQLSAPCRSKAISKAFLQSKCFFCRIVEMTAEVVGVPYEFKKCDLLAGENMKVEDFL